MQKLTKSLTCQSHNPVHNILELYRILAQARFATRKTKLDIYYGKPVIQVASQVAEWLKI